MLNYGFNRHIFDYVYNTVVLGLMTCKSDDQALEYLDRQLALAVNTYIKAYN